MDVIFSASASSGAVVDNGTSTSEFWAQERVWQKSVLEKTSVAKVSEPVTVVNTFQNHTTYLVRSTFCIEGVRRRYSDFDWLRDILVARYHGIAVPLLPEKKIAGSTTKAVVDERVQGLENFLALVLANPYLRLDVTLEMFLTQKAGPEFEQAKKAAGQGIGSDPNSNIGLGRWFGAICRMTLPTDSAATEKAVGDLSVQTAQLEANLVNLLAGFTRLYDATRSIAQSLCAVKDAMSDLSSRAHESLAVLGDDLVSMRGSVGELVTRAKKGTDVFSNAYDLSVFQPNEIQIFLLEGFLTEIHRVRGLKTALAVRDAAKKSYGEAWVNQDKIAFQKAEFEKKGKMDKAREQVPKLAEAIDNTRRHKERLDDITKGLLYVEGARISRIRVERFHAMLCQYAALNIASGVRLQEIWSNYLAASGVDQSACVRDAQATLVGSTSMHTLDSTGPLVAYMIPEEFYASSGAVAEPVAINANGGAGALASTEPTSEEGSAERAYFKAKLAATSSSSSKSAAMTEL